MSKVYKIITDKIIAQLEAGTVPWNKPWSCGGQISNFVSKKAYTGINPFLLNMTEFKNPNWLTYKQAKDLGGTILKGSKSEQIIFFNFIDKKNDEGKKNTFPMLRYYNVFNLDQCEGIDHDTDTTEFANDPIEACENIVKNYPNPPTFIEDTRACYLPQTDAIKTPNIKHYEVVEEYYCTIFHEMIHSTGSKKRLNRDFGASMKDDLYAKEELIAELGAAMLCGMAGIENKTIDNSAAYINGWLKRLKKDDKLIISAASSAQKAANHIRNIKLS